MPPKAPKFWSRENHPAGALLSPFGWLYGAVVQGRFALTTPYRSALPVICIGNFTLGGGGKTPLALKSAELLKEMGARPVFLTRGFGGRIKGPHLVDLARDTAMDVGDEPLLLAVSAPVVVSADRPSGAKFIEQMAADVIIMDDGFQNPSLHKDLSLVVVDEATGIGNGRIFPAGPLRTGLDFQLARTDALVISGPVTRAMGENLSASREIEAAFDGEVLRVDLTPSGNVDWLRGARVTAVTGIARPDKFYASLQGAGALIVQMVDYPDHYMFTQQDAKGLLAANAVDKALIVMTRKDWVRLPASGALGRLRRAARVLDIELRLDDPARLRALFRRVISASPDSA